MTLLARALVCLLAALASTASDGGRGVMNPSWVVVPGEAVGPLRLGMSQDELRAAVGLPDRTNLGPWEYLFEGYAVTFGSNRRVSAILGGDAGEPQGRLVKAFVARTREGIGMGSSHADVVRAFGDPDADTIYRSGGELLAYRTGIEVVLIADAVAHLVVRPPANRPSRGPGRPGAEVPRH